MWGMCIMRNVNTAAAATATATAAAVYNLRNCVMRKILCGITVRKAPDWLSAKTT